MDNRTLSFGQMSNGRRGPQNPSVADADGPKVHRSVPYFSSVGVDNNDTSETSGLKLEVEQKLFWSFELDPQIWTAVT